MPASGRPSQVSPQPAGWSVGTPDLVPTQPISGGAQQVPQVSGMPNQANRPASGAMPGMQPGNLQRMGVASFPVARKRRRAGRIWASTFLILILLLAALAGVWFLLARPYLHDLAQTELDRALSVPENQILLSMLAIPPGVPLPANLSVIHGTESAMNDYLSKNATDQVQNLQMAITPAGMNLSFTVYGQNCAVSAVPILSNGQIQVTNVQVQGVLGLIMSNDELTQALNSNLQNFSAQMTHKVTKITLLEHEIDVQIA